MMMILNSRNSAPLVRARRARFVLFVVLVVLLAPAALWRAPLAELFGRAAAPLMHFRYGNAQNDVADPSRLAVAEADRDALYQENLDLKARLGRPGTAPVRILGAVLLRPPATPYDTLVIDAGKEEGAVVGDYVSAGGSGLVGTISEVYAHAARVRLFS